MHLMGVPQVSAAFSPSFSDRILSIGLCSHLLNISTSSNLLALLFLIFLGKLYAQCGA